MIGAAVWLDPPSGGILGDLSYPSPLFDCRTLVPMLQTIKAFTDRDRDGAGDAFARRSGELPGQRSASAFLMFRLMPEVYRHASTFLPGRDPKPP